MEFAGLDDDLFEDERQRGKTDEEYSARFCDETWFLDVEIKELVSNEDTLNVKKFTAEYLFLRKDYDGAINHYKNILSSLPVGNVVTRRESCEGIARSYMKKGTPENAIKYAEILHETSKTVEQATVSCTLLIDVYFAAGKYGDALLAAQTLVTLHTYNSDAWLKLACVYAAIHSIVIPNVQQLLLVPGASKTVLQRKGINDTYLQVNVQCRNEDTLTLEEALWEDVAVVAGQHLKRGIELGIYYVALCLLRALILLKKTEGTAIGFAVDFSTFYQKNIIMDLNILLDKASLQLLKQKVLKSGDVMEKMSGPSQDVSDFVDRGSSKFKSEENDSNFEAVPQKNFESRWFSCVNDIYGTI